MNERLAARATLLVGFAFVLVGVVMVDSWLSRASFLVPIAVLLGGVAWSMSPRASGAPASAHVTSTPSPEIHPVVDRQQPPATTASVPLAVPPPDRDAAALAFELDPEPISEDPNPVQCPRCGRYRGLRVAPDLSTVSCSSCRMQLPYGRHQPRTVVRMIAISETASTREGSGRQPVIDTPTLRHPQ